MIKHPEPRWFGLLAALAAAAAFAGCSGDDERAPTLASGGSTSGGRPGGGTGGKASGGTAGEGGGDAGSGAATASCGDGVLSDGEECDGEDQGEQTCVDFGFEEGALSCSAQCEVVVDGCSGTERCGDASDNDGDALADCADDDCAAECADPCSLPVELSDPAEVLGTTAGRADVSDSSCGDAAASGADMVYTFTASHSGMLEVELETDAALDVVVRTDCGASGSELACSGSRLSRPVTEGDTVHVIVNGLTAADEGTFTLRVLSRALGVCADGYRDEGESCDDGNELPLDGCDDACNLESDETEPNEAFDDSVEYTGGYIGEIDPAEDVDYVAVTVADAPASITAEVKGFNDDCDALRIDTFLELLDTDGTTVIDSDDDGGGGYCSKVLAAQLPAGTYYLRVSKPAGDFGAYATFPYQLLVTVNACGNAIRGPGEQCDDGDQVSGDGCSATCQAE